MDKHFDYDLETLTICATVAREYYQEGQEQITLDQLRALGVLVQQAVKRLEVRMG